MMSVGLKKLMTQFVKGSTVLALLTSTSTGYITSVFAEEGNSTPFESEVTLKIPVYDRGVEGVPTVNDNYWTNYVQENFGSPNNIKVEYVPINRQNVMTDYSLLASSKDLPTILMEYDYPKLSQWANEGYLAPFDMEEFKAAAPTYYAHMENLIDYTQMQGDTYFVLGKRPNWDKAYMFQTFYRKDWLDQIGVEEYPKTYSEWKDAMVKIQEEGIAANPGGGFMLPGQGADQHWEFLGHPVDEKMWATYVSVVIPPLGYDPIYNFLKRENEKYYLGITNPEYYITDSSTAEAKFINGETFTFSTYLSADMPVLKSFYETNPDAQLGIVPPAENDEEGGTSANFLVDNPFGMIVGFSSTASEDELKAAWMYLEWISQEENLFVMQWGIEGEHYTVNEETGFPETVGNYEGDKKQGYNNNVDYWCITTTEREIGELRDMVYAKTPKGLPQDFTDEVYELALRKEELTREGYAVNQPTFIVPIEAETEYGGTLTELYKELRDKLVMAKPEEFDSLYEQFVQQYNDAGFAEIIEERAAAYDEGNTTKLIGNE